MKIRRFLSLFLLTVLLSTLTAVPVYGLEDPAIRAKAAAGGLVRIVVGGLRTAGGTLIRSPQHAAKGARLLARGRGILAASVGGGVHREYDH